MGCIFGELLGLRPMFKGEEAKIEIGAGKKGGVPFQKDQLSRIVEVLGSIESRLLILIPFNVIFVDQLDQLCPQECNGRQLYIYQNIIN